MSQYFTHLLTMSSVTQEDGFTHVTRGRKKRKASGSPTLPGQPKPTVVHRAVLLSILFLSLLPVSKPDNYLNS